MNSFSLIKTDYKRYIATGAKNPIKIIFFNQSFWATSWFRLINGIYFSVRKIPIIRSLVGLLGMIVLKISQIFVGISIPIGTKIGKGLFISHSGTIIINSNSIIGDNCNIAPMTIIGWGKSEGEFGVPTIGDRVWIGPGAKIFGPITIGNDVAIGANAVVNKPIPDNAVVVSNNKIVNYNSSKEYIKF
ncbi:MAG: serine acetyltransferase [Polaribacter sp.]|uniref:serine O-acetyltransferase n=1 Tax=Polaribacter sp. TaxID=1920175 RepID=UPI003266E77B